MKFRKSGASVAGETIAIVCPWYGPHLRGGAEQQAAELAVRLSAAGYRVDVLTTTSKSPLGDWTKPAFPPRAVTQNGITVRRFRVDRRNRRAFDALNAELLAMRPQDLRVSVSPLEPEREEIFVRDNICSRELEAYLERNGRRYHAIVFIPYLYGTTLRALPLVAERAYLQPCLHDEPYAYLDCVEDVVRLARGLFFNSRGEFEFALRRFGPGIITKSTIAGEGVEVLPQPAQTAVKDFAFAPERSRYVLYLGRQDVSKNLHTLVSAFAGFRRRYRTSDLVLVLAGDRAAQPFGDRASGVIDLGRVSESEKSSLLRNCRALLQPSLNESFSRVIHEAWVCGRPVIVSGDCATTAMAVEQAKGGFTPGTLEQWIDAIARVDAWPDAALDELGRQGRAYAKEHASWDRVIERYRRTFSGAPTPKTNLVIRQEVPEGDSEIEIYAESLMRALRLSGIAAPLGRGKYASPGTASRTIRHIRGGGTSAAEFEAGRGKTLVYHCDRHAVPMPLGPLRTIPAGPVFGTTPRALAELRKAGVEHAQLLPLYLDPSRYDRRPDPALMAALQDGKTNLLYAGPLRDVDAVEALLAMFLQYLSFELDARLSIIATRSNDREFFERVYAKVASLDLVDTVFVAADLNELQMQALYQTADLFISLDQGDYPPDEILRAMWFDVPVIAYKPSVTAELAASAGLVLGDRGDTFAIAALAQMAVERGDLRHKIISAQRRVREQFDARSVAAAFTEWQNVSA